MSKYILCIVAVFAFSFPVLGQQLPSKSQTAADSKAQQELTRKVQALLIETAQSVRGLRNRENQVQVRFGIADLLWKDHEAAARLLYQEAFDNLRQALADADQSNPESSVDHDSLARLQERVLESLGKHDPMMARDLLHKSRPPVPSDAAKSDSSATDVPAVSGERASDTRLELSLAISMIDQSPTDAVRAAREALRDGYPSELVPLLLKLGEKEPKTAKELALEIVNKLRKENFDSNYEAVGLAVFLVGDVISSTQQPKEEEPAEKRAELLDAQTGRELIEFLTDAALKKPSGALFSNLRSMVDELEQFAPARAALLKQKSSEIEKENTDANPYIRLQQLSQTSDPKALLELAQTAPREVRDSLYSQAASLAWQQGDKAKANEIATTKISSPYERSRLLLSFQDQTIAELIRTEDFVQARQVIAQTRSTERRVQQLTDLAAAVAEKNDKKAAIELLQEAQGLLPAKARNENELDSLLRLAGAFSRLDPDRSFALISSTIDQINELMAATALVANFGPSIVTVKDDEFDIDSYSRVSYGLRILSSRDIRTLAEVNFEKTKGLFDRFQRPEIRIAAYLLMSQSILEPESEDDCTCQERLKKQKLAKKELQ